jgi:hypothetical protein
MVHRIIYYRKSIPSTIIIYPNKFQADLHLHCLTMKFRNEKEMKDFRRVLINQNFKVIKKV